LAIYVGVLLGVIVLALSLELLSNPEPIYKGKTINAWLKVTAKAFQIGYEENEAYEALRNAGPEVVPYLIAALKKKESRFDRFYKNVWHRLPMCFQYRMRPPQDAEVFQAIAISLFEEIRPTAKLAATPELLKLFDSPDETERSVASSLLRRFGSAAKPAVPKLIEYLTNSDWKLHSYACEILAAIGPEAEAAVPALVRLLRDEDDGTKPNDPAYFTLYAIDRETWEKVRP